MAYGTVGFYRKHRRSMGSKNTDETQKKMCLRPVRRAIFLQTETRSSAPWVQASARKATGDNLAGSQTRDEGSNEESYLPKETTDNVFAVRLV